MSSRKRLGLPPSPVLGAINDALEQNDDDVGVLELVSVTKIHFNPHNPRKVLLDRTNPRNIPEGSPHRVRIELELDRLEELAAGIQAAGLMQPVGIYRHGDHFVLVWGERRLLAHILLGRATIPARILPHKPSNVLAAQLIENLNRSDLSLLDRCNGFRQLIAESQQTSAPILSDKDLRSRVGLRPTMAYSYWAVAHAPDDVRAAISDGRLTRLRDAQKISLLPTSRDREAAIAGLSGAGITADSGGTPGATVVATPPRPPRGRGRPVTSVALPRIKNASVIRQIAERLTTKQEFARWADVDWSDLKIAGDLLRQIIKQMERRMTPANTK